MPIDAVIFDMDGVIVATEDYWWESRVDYVGSLGGKWTLDDQRACMGVNTVEWGRIMQERALPDVSIETIIAEIKRRVIERVQARLPVLPGAVEAVHLAASRYPVGLASGSPTEIIDTVMALTQLDRLFKTMVFGDNMRRGKPHPDIYLEAARQLGVEPSRCVGIEDSVNGIRSLHAADMCVIAVPSPGFPLPEDIVQLSDVVLPSLEYFTLDVVDRLG